MWNIIHDDCTLYPYNYKPTHTRFWFGQHSTFSPLRLTYTQQWLNPADNRPCLVKSWIIQFIWAIHHIRLMEHSHNYKNGFGYDLAVELTLDDQLLYGIAGAVSMNASKFIQHRRHRFNLISIRWLYRFVETARLLWFRKPLIDILSIDNAWVRGRVGTGTEEKSLFYRIKTPQIAVTMCCDFLKCSSPSDTD